jgi:transcriptional regulator with XRE-family HTH domain
MYVDILGYNHHMRTTMESIREHFSFEERRAAVRKFRKISGLSQDELARLARVSQSKISEFESGAQDLGDAAFERVTNAVANALAARRFELSNTSTLASSRCGRPQTRLPQAHYFNIDRRSKGGGFVVEYQGPGMVVCEEYQFDGDADLREWMEKCLVLGEQVWSSNLEPLE